jgi:hypothetical protein
MKEIFEFMFAGFWHFVGCWLILLVVLQTILIIIQRFYRMIIILIHGYPPTHCDADGDKIVKNKK